MRGGSDKWSRTHANRLLRRRVRDAIRDAIRDAGELDVVPLLREVSDRYGFASDGALDAYDWAEIAGDPSVVAAWCRK